MSDDWTLRGTLILEDMIVLLRQNGTPIVTLPDLPGAGPIEGIKAIHGEGGGMRAKRGGRIYFLAFTSNRWVEDS